MTVKYSGRLTSHMKHLKTLQRDLDSLQDWEASGSSILKNSVTGNMIYCIGLHWTASDCIKSTPDCIKTALDCIGPRFFNCIELHQTSILQMHRTALDIRLGLGLRLGPPSLLCVGVGLLQDSIRYHADAVRCCPLMAFHF